MDNLSTTSRWVELKLFELKVISPSDRLYANGRQQVQLRVAIEGVDAMGNAVQLSREEMDSLTLVEHDGGKAIPFVNPGPPSLTTHNARWSWSYIRDNNFVFHAGSTRGVTASSQGSSAGGARPDQYVTYRDVFIRSNADTPLQLAATIKRDDGTFYYSREFYDGAVWITPVAVPKYRAIAYKLEAVQVTEHAENPYVIYYNFSLNESNEKVEFRAFSMTPGNLISRLDRASHIGGVTGFATPGSSIIHWGAHARNDRPKKVLPRFVANDKAIVVACMATNLGSTTRNHQSVINAVDMYGNLHSVRIRMNNPRTQFASLALY